MTKSVGLQDVPLCDGKEDNLGVDQYARALASFITTCKTPMSIGIQGDWGLGKTSLMRLVESYLQEESKQSGVPLPCYWVNTWQLSQFNLGDKLPTLVIQNLIGKVTKNESKKAKVESLLSKIERASTHPANQVVKSQVDAAAGGETFDPGKALEELKAQFESACLERVKAEGEKVGRVVFFIDDLDRLLPERTVEFMEVMKNFLDVDQVIFVLAVDYAVVVKGLEAKFGVGIKDLGGRSFFDKIIQVPFRMPDRSYQVERFVRSIFEQIGVGVHGEIDDYVNLLRYSFGFNPRSIKRHCNTLLLLKLVMENSEDQHQQAVASDAHKMKLLFASLCMEAAHPSLYKYLAREVTLEKIGRLATDQGIDEFIGSDEDPFGSRSPNLMPFGKLFHQIVDKDRDGSISQGELTALQHVLNVSAIASISEQETTTESFSRYVDDMLRNQTPAVREALQELLDLMPEEDRNTRRAKKENVIIVGYGGADFAFFEVDPLDSGRIRVFLNPKRDDKGGTIATYVDELAELGYDFKTHGQNSRSGYEKGRLNIVFNPETEPDRFEIAKKVVAWHCN